MIKKCSICGNEFHTDYTFTKYCSDECRHTAKVKRAKKWNKDHYEESLESARRRNRTKKMKACSAEHNNCFGCPTLDGECLFDC